MQEGERNGMWKGDNVGYKTLHQWIRNHLPKPVDSKCVLCNKNLAYDVACINGIYNRNLNNWQWQCRRCHMREDGRMLKLLERIARNHPCLGVKHSVESRMKRSQSLMGHKISDETRKKIGDKLRGRKYRPRTSFLLPNNRE